MQVRQQAQQFFRGPGCRFSSPSCSAASRASCRITGASGDNQRIQGRRLPEAASYPGEHQRSSHAEYSGLELGRTWRSSRWSGSRAVTWSSFRSAWKPSSRTCAWHAAPTLSWRRLHRATPASPVPTTGHPRRRRGLGQRHHGQRQPALDHGRDRSDHRHRIGEHPAGRLRHHRIRVHRAQPDGEHRPHRLGTLGEAPQPAAHRLTRATQIGRDPPKPQPTARFRSQRRHDHRRRIGTAQQRAHRQQHMGHPAAGTPRPARPQLPRPIRAAHQPRPSPTPTRQHLLQVGHSNPPAASRRSTTSGSASTVTTAPPSANRRPSRSPGQRDNARAVAYQRPDHRAAPTPQTATRTDHQSRAAQPQRRNATPTWSP